MISDWSKDCSITRAVNYQSRQVHSNVKINLKFRFDLTGLIIYLMIKSSYDTLLCFWHFKITFITVFSFLTTFMNITVRNIQKPINKSHKSKLTRFSSMWIHKQARMFSLQKPFGLFNTHTKSLPTVRTDYQRNRKHHDYYPTE